MMLKTFEAELAAEGGKKFFDVVCPQPITTGSFKAHCCSKPATLAFGSHAGNFHMRLQQPSPHRKPFLFLSCRCNFG
jgi:hypothetical protein